MQPETRAPSVPLRLSWCPCLISASAFLGSTPTRLLSPSIPSTLPMTVTSAVCPVEYKTVLHLSVASHTEDHSLFLEPLASRTLGSPGFPAASLGLLSQALLMAPEVLSLLTYWILTSTWWNSAGLGSQVSSYLYIPAFGLNTAFMLMTPSLFPRVLTHSRNARLEYATTSISPWMPRILKFIVQNTTPDLRSPNLLPLQWSL